MSFLSPVTFSALLISLVAITALNAQSENVLTQSYFDELSNKRYNTKIAPEGNDGHGSPIIVLASLYLIDIHKMEDTSMDYKASFYFRQSWNDSRLAYPDQDISTIIMGDPAHIWTPDLFFVQEKEGVKHNIIHPNDFVNIKPDGEVKFSTRLSITFSCPMDFTKFPHDTQKCLFQIESYGKTRDKLYLNWDNRTFVPVTKADEINLLSFKVTDINYSATDSGKYRVLNVEITFERNIGFFMTRLYVPFILLVALSWISFWIKAKMSTLRLSLLLVIMYLMINIGSGINSYIPPAPYTKASDIWIAFCESFVFAAFLEFIFVSIISKSEKKFEKNRHASATDPEVPIIGDSDTKEKPAMGGLAIRMVASRLSKGCKISSRVDTMSSILFPVLFIIFNFLYWIIY